MSALVLPGQPLSSSNTTPALQGESNTYSRGGQLYSTIIGNSVRNGSTISVLSQVDSARIPQPNSVIIGTVIRLTRQAATISILTVDGFPCKENYIALIRNTDITQTAKDTMKAFDWFRPKDVVRAKVISLGDSRSYFCSTAANSLGVLFAISAAGNSLEAKNWTTMVDEITLEEETRKVAGPE